MSEKGKLSIVATPIGNLEDITLRALRVLKEADGILCEDTRQTLKLLNHYDIRNRLIAYHKFNEKDALEKVISYLEDGESLALVSDAGLPLISDPGSLLVKTCKERGIPVEVIPGANAALSALQLSGLDARRFTFFGFPPKNKKEQRKFIENVLNSGSTAIVYESPHHIEKTLEMILEKDPERQISISREITKKFEETQDGTPNELLERFKTQPPKGEFVMVIEAGSEPLSEAEPEKTVEELYTEFIEGGMSSKEAIKKIAALKNLKKRDVYASVKIENK